MPELVHWHRQRADRGMSEGQITDSILLPPPEFDDLGRVLIAMISWCLIFGMTIGDYLILT